MNDRMKLFLLPIILIGIFCIFKFDFSILGLIVFGILTFFYIIICIGVAKGRVDAKKDLYLANKYDEQKNNK